MKANTAAILVAALGVGACASANQPAPQGSVRVTVTTTGPGTIPAGYQVTVDGASPATIPATGSTTVATGIGAHQIRLTNIATHCTADWYAPQSVNAVADSVVDVAYHVVCGVPRTGSIVFTSDVNNNFQPDVYIMKADGTDQQRLTTSHGDQPAVSPGGTRIVFVAASHLWIMNADGTGQVALTNTAGVDNTPSWSPDGTHVTFLRASGGNNFSLMTITADGRQDSTLRTSDRSYAAPIWSPDTMHIAFTNDQQIDVLDLRTGAFKNIRPPDNNGFPVVATWSPTGDRLAYIFSRYDGGWEIRTVHADGTADAVLLQPGYYPGSMDWSRDGLKLVIGALANPLLVNMDLFVFTFATGASVNITNTLPTREASPAWTP